MVSVALPRCPLSAYITCSESWSKKSPHDVTANISEPRMSEGAIIDFNFIIDNSLKVYFNTGYEAAALWELSEVDALTDNIGSHAELRV